MDNSLSKKYGRTTGIINDGVSIYLSKGVSVFLSAIGPGYLILTLGRRNGIINCSKNGLMFFVQI
jgi:hypothetical protein